MQKLHTTLLIFALATVTNLVAQSKLLHRQSGYFYLNGTDFVLFIDSSEYTYNVNRQLTEIKRYSYTDIWRNDARFTNYDYDANGNLLYYLVESLGPNDILVPFVQYNYQYDTEGRLLLETREEMSVNGWELVGKTENVYDANGNLESETHLTYRYLFFYDSNGLLLTQLEQSFTNGNWTNKNRFTSSYDPGSTKPFKIQTEKWVSNAWEISAQKQFTYDAQGNTVTEDEAKWDGAAWVNTYQSLNTYDNENRLIIWQRNIWSNETWVNLLRTSYDFDAAGDQLLEVGEFWKNNNWARQSIGYFYYIQASNATAPTNAALKVFPNPTSGATTLLGDNISRLLLYDNTGKLIHSESLQNESVHELQIQHLPAGQYWLHVWQNAGYVVTPLVVHH